MERMRARYRGRIGFTLAEVVVSTAIVVLLAAATAPSLTGFIDRQKVQQTATILQQIQAGIVNGTNAGMFNLMTNYPGFVHDLANPIVVGVATDHNSCGNAAAHRWVAASLTAWDGAGPFVTFPTTTAYAPNGAVVTTPIGKIVDSLQRDTIPHAAAPVGSEYIAVRVSGVRVDDATTLDQIMDGGDGSSAGSIQWWTSVATRDTVDSLKFLIPVRPLGC